MIKKEEAVLLVIDIQGKLATLMHNKENLYRSLQTVIQAFKIMEIPIIWVEQIPEKLGKTVDEVSSLLQNDTSIKKHTFSCYQNDEFKNKLESYNRKQILVTGIETHICIYQTTMELLQNGYEVEIVADAVSSREYENKRIALEKIVNAGGKLTTTEMLVFELLKSADDSNFKKIVPLLK